MLLWLSQNRQEHSRWIAPLLLLTVFVSSVQSAEPPLHQQIDTLITKGFARYEARPADVSSDAEFLRRVSLDLTGTIPETKTTLAFLRDKAADKRARLIDRLLSSPEHAQHLAVVLDVMLMERRRDRWVTTQQWRTYLEESLKQNKPLDVLSREILGADGTDETLRPAARFYLDRAVDKDALVRDIGRLFLGVDLQCAQCHDHPSIADYLHRHYHSLSVFVSGSKTFRRKDGTIVLQEMFVPETQYASVFKPDTMLVTGPRILNNAALKVPKFEKGKEYVEKVTRNVRAVPHFSLRKLLAQELPKDKAFARNLANRLWAMMMGRGLVHPLDMHHAKNPPSHPELLDLLAQRLIAMKFDTRTFLRELALSKTYQRSSLAPKGVAPDDVPQESFALANMKGLSPEQLFRSLLRATDAEKLFAQEIELALKEDEEQFTKLKADPKAWKDAIQKERDRRTNEFVSVFAGTAGRPEGEFQASLSQALFLANSEMILNWIKPGSGNLTAQLMKMKTAEQLAESLYLSVLSRPPEAEETKRIKEYLASAGQKKREQAIVQIVWSLLACAEFRLNH